ncbi:hypothetical protein DPMN_171704 [Dreissena polymorpha]|uniref:Uncharacterized protein n=1 Tax=Dreissena polymorpha TaxID=45954 RepID=A0A9D4E262_DREPO|nr:hypothetical protein DPMN_171704 [Dreissena polymorpha]
MTAADLPEAGMEISVVSRGCGIHNGVETPKCTPILDIVGAGQNVAILSQLSQYSAMFQNVTYNGQWCQSANGSVMP